MEKITVEVVNESQLDQWDRYVEEHPDSLFFHKAGWYRVVKKSFGHKPYYLWAVNEDNEVKGILPLFEVKSSLFGHSLVSVPFCVYGGAVANSTEIRTALEDYAAELARELSVDYLEIRNIKPTRDDWPTKSMHATFVRELKKTEEEILLSIKNKQRAVVRKSIKNKLDRELQNDVEDFFTAYSTSVKNLGTPVFSKRYFKELKEEFGSDCEISTIKKDGQLHCSVLSFYFKGTVLPYYGGGLPECRTSKAMDFMYFDLMCRASEAGYDKYDFGRSKLDTGPYNYKRHWGFNPEPLHYQYVLVNAENLPELNPNNPKYQLMIKVWKKLPLKLSQILGPFVSKYLG